MKKILSCLLLLSVSPLIFAQSFFVKAGAGGSVAGSSCKLVDLNAYALKNAVPSGQGSFLIGLTYGKWQVEGGVGFLQTGVKYVMDESRSVPAAPPFLRSGETIELQIALPDVRYTIKNAHLVMPLTISYILNKEKKISFCPGAGIAAAYNFKGTLSADRVGGGWNNRPLSSAVIAYDYNKLGFMAVLKLDVQYKIGRQVSIWASPSYQQMLTSLTARAKSDPLSKTYDHALLLSVGVRYDLSCSGRCPFTSGRNAAAAN